MENLTPLQAYVLCGNTFDYVIAPYLNIKDIYNMSLVSGTLYKRMDEKYIMKHIQKRIVYGLQQIFGDNYYTFAKKLYESKAVISGSFILQCILNEKWTNSDIDIYVAYNGPYDQYVEDKKIVLSSVEEYLKTKTSYSAEGYYRTLYDVRRTINYFYNKNIMITQDLLWDDSSINATTIQVVEIYTNLQCPNCMKGMKCIKYNDVLERPSFCKPRKQTLWNHVQNTGFDICKNMVYFDKNLNLQLDIKNYRQIINKKTTFSVLDIDDFYFRIEKYSKRGFLFKPKFNKLIYLEYLFFKKTPCQIQKTYDKDTHKFKRRCRGNCPVQLLFRNVRHAHRCEYDETSGRYVNYIVIEPNNKMFDKLLLNGDEESYKLIEKCDTLDKYAKIRNNLAVQNNKEPISIFNSKNLKYDIQYGLPADPPPPKKVVTKDLMIKKKPTYKKPEKPIYKKPENRDYFIEQRRFQKESPKVEVIQEEPNISQKKDLKEKKKPVSQKNSGWTIVGKKKN